MGLNTTIDSQADLRMEICKRCPLYKIQLGAGAICNSKLYLNTDTGEVSEIKKPGFKNGCGCRLENKVKQAFNHCPLQKW